MLLPLPNLNGRRSGEDIKCKQKELEMSLMKSGKFFDS